MNTEIGYNIVEYINAAVDAGRLSLEPDDRELISSMEGRLPESLQLTNVERELLVSIYNRIE